MLKRQRFVNEAREINKSQIGGGKVFRQSQVKDDQRFRNHQQQNQPQLYPVMRRTSSLTMSQGQPNNMQSFASKIKANSLSDIQDNS